MIQVSQGGKTVKSSGISSDGNRAVSCAGDVAQFVQAPVTGMLPFGGVEKKNPEQPYRLSYHFTTRTLYG